MSCLVTSQPTNLGTKVPIFGRYQVLYIGRDAALTEKEGCAAAVSAACQATSGVSCGLARNGHEKGGKKSPFCFMFLSFGPMAERLSRGKKRQLAACLSTSLLR